MSHDIRGLNNFVWTCMTRGMCCKHFRHRDNNKREFWNRKLHEGCYKIHMHVHQYLAVCGLQKENREDTATANYMSSSVWYSIYWKSSLQPSQNRCDCAGHALHRCYTWMTNRLPLLKVSDDPVLQCQLHARHVLCKQCVIGATKTWPLHFFFFSFRLKQVWHENDPCIAIVCLYI